MPNKSQAHRLKASDIFETTPCLTLDQITAYVEERLSPDEHHQIEKHLVDCRLCSDALEGFVLSGDKTKTERTVASINKYIHAKLSAPFTRRKTRRIIHPIAAILLIGTAALLYIFQNQPIHKKLYDQYFQLYPNTIPLVRGESQAGPMQLAMIEYEAENYKASLTILLGIIRDDPEDNRARFYAAMAFLCLNRPRQAVPNLQQLLKSQDTDYHEKARWYLALAYLKIEAFDQAKSLFREIASSGGFYYEKSAQLLDALTQ